MGDGVMAVWGARTVREDDTEQAVLAALELLEGVATMGGEVAARAGVNTGEATVDMSGQDAGMVIGDLVNTAARFQGAAAPGTVLVGAGTFRAAGSRIEFVDAGAKVLKGKGAPVATWIARGARRGEAAGVQAPFLGRDQPLRQLVQAVTPAERRARLVCLVGTAGVGKTRLTDEFERTVSPNALVVRGRSPGSAPGATLVAFSEMVRTLAAVDESADEGSIRRQVHRMLAESMNDPDERGWVEPALLRLLGVDAEGLAPTELFSRWRLLFERLAERRPLVLVFDDAQWADETTLGFIDHLLEWVRDESILIVAIARPELLARRPTWGAEHSRATQLVLTPLPSTVIVDILDALVPDLPRDVAAAVVGRCEGIPLYVVEIVRMLAAEQRIVSSDTGYRIAGDIGTLRVPESMQALVAARLDALQPMARALALDASVLGDRFTTKTLAAMCPVAPAELPAALATLVDAGVIASHDLAAYRCAPNAPDADVLAVRAVSSLRAAIDQAWLLNGFAQVVALASDALRLSTSEAEHALLEERRATALIEVGDYADALIGLEEALAFHERSRDGDAAARVACAVGETMLRLARPGAARALLERAIGEHSGSVDQVRLGSLQVQVARARDFEGESEQGFRLAEHVAAVAADIGATGLRADALVTKGTCCGRLERVDQGVDALTEGIRLAEESGRIGGRLRGMTNLVWLLMEHDPRRAKAFAVDGCSFARRLGATSMERFMLSFPDRARPQPRRLGRCRHRARDGRPRPMARRRCWTGPLFSDRHLGCTRTGRVRAARTTDGSRGGR